METFSSFKLSKSAIRFSPRPLNEALSFCDVANCHWIRQGNSNNAAVQRNNSVAWEYCLREDKRIELISLYGILNVRYN